MPWQWPWSRSRPEPPERDIPFEQDRHALEVDIGQIKKVNEYLLNKAVARGWITEEVARTIRMTQAYQEGALEIGPDTKPPE